MIKKSLIRAGRSAYSFDQTRGFTSGKTGFTLIELLVVIAIIAILAAIIFPVFASVRENARRASCMTNMKTISTALKQYELDNRKYPDFLFAPAIAANGSGCALINNKPVVATGGGAACTPEQASATGKLGGDFVDTKGNVVAQGGLYPEYVKTLNTFVCPNNSEFLPNGDPKFNQAPGTTDYPVTESKAYYDANTLDKTQSGSFEDKYGDATLPGLSFYKFDSYDANPAILKDGSGKALPRVSNGVSVVRYQRQWMPIANNPNPPLGTYPNTDDRTLRLYQNQLVWRNPSDDTVVTMCSYHATNSKVVVLYLSGTAKVLDLATLKERAATSDAALDFDTYKMTP